MNVHALSTESTHELSQVTVAEEETVTQDKQVERISKLSSIYKV